MSGRNTRLKRDGWSQLPRDLLIEVSKRIHTRFEIIQFRSVCQSWRSSTLLPPPPPPFTPILPIPIGSQYKVTIVTVGANNVANNVSEELRPRPGFCKLVERTFYTIRPNEQQRQPESSSSKNAWLIKVEEETPNVVHLFDPLLRCLNGKPTKPFSEVLNLANFNIYGHCKEYFLARTDMDSRFSPKTGLYNLGGGDVEAQKVVLSSTASYSEIVILALCHSRLLFFKSGDDTWTKFVIEDHNDSITDIINYKGELIAVDDFGKAFVVDPYTLTSKVLTNRVVGDDHEWKRFVESNGQLFLVGMYAEGHGGPYPPCDSYGRSTPIDCKVFSLDEEKQQWIPVEDLGDRVFLMSPQGSYSISALDFPGCKGDCILFTDYHFFSDHEEDTFSHNIGVFDLKAGTFEELVDSSYSLFWPPPTWISMPKRLSHSRMAS